MLKSFCRRFIFITLLWCVNASAVDLVRYVESEDGKQSYFVDLLKLTLETSRDKYGDYLLIGVAVDMAQGRSSIMLERNEVIDLTWRMSSREIESKLQTIYFPLLKGLMGHRIFIIRAGEQAIFNKKITVKELKNISVGQGQNWPDTDILIANNFKVAAGYDDYLLTMLERKRFDYFPRALHEPWFEIKDKPAFVIEKNLMLRYPAPMYFYVNKTNKRLHQRLVYGLEKLLNNGKFEQFFLTHPITSGIIEKSKAKQRLIFDLNNPLLSEQSQALLSDKRLWADLSSK